MRTKHPYETDKEFLQLLNQERVTEQFARITLLNWEENPIQNIEGIITGGSLNLDGHSSSRRTCSLSLFIDKQEQQQILKVENFISINKKIQLEIGISNTTDRYLSYPIIWFPQGIYVISNASISRSVSGLNISLQLKDKMSLLNGECGGIIPASTRFDEYETTDENGKYILKHPIISQIIREAVNHFGGEQLGKILISDIPPRIKKVMKWIGNTPVYYDKETHSLTTNFQQLQNHAYTKFDSGEDIGFIYTDFIYPKELIGNAGSSVCTILDSIAQFLGNFEYFYDTDGNFHFQEKKNYLNTSHAKVELDKMKNEDYLIDKKNGKSVYAFNDSNLISSYSNNPQFNMIKNDFVVWGLKENANGNKMPIRYHLAIDSKPTVGNTYQCFFYEDPNDNLKKAKMPIQYPSFDNIKQNPGQEGVFYLAQDTGIIYTWDGQGYIPYKDRLTSIKTKDWRSELYLSGVQTEPLGLESNYYYTELLNEWPKLYDLEAGDFYAGVKTTPSDIDYFLDFIDSSAAISEFSVSNIGRRSIVINDQDVNCVFEPEIPDYVLIELGTNETQAERQECEYQGQNYIQVPSTIYSMLTGGGNKNSAYNKVRELLYQYTSYNESISLQAIPIYNLEPNTCIQVEDSSSSIHGTYIISTISIPLGVGGTMSISAIKALERI